MRSSHILKKISETIKQIAGQYTDEWKEGYRQVSGLKREEAASRAAMIWKTF